VITPRRTRLLRTADLEAFRATLVGLTGALDPGAARDTFLLVPTRAAGEQLRRTLEDCLLTRHRAAIVLPRIGTRADWYEELASRRAATTPLPNAFEREVILAAVARDLVEHGIAPPFEIRPGLVAEMLDLYDLIRRLGRSVADFERNFREDLERDQDTDRGAAKLLQQTAFLTAAFTAYERRLVAAGAHDEHGLRESLVISAAEADAAPSAPALTRVIVTVADRIADPDGLWPADFELLTKLPQLTSVDIVSTEAVLGAGFLERLHGVLPELEEEHAGGTSLNAPVLLSPPPHPSGGAAPIAFSYRDREEELAAVARWLKAERRALAAEGDGASRAAPAHHQGASASPKASPLHRTALVVRRPLPYLYLAREVFGSAGVPFETLDTLPLAAEPYAAALDLALEVVAADFSRTHLIALLRSPHFRFAESTELTTRAIAALDFSLADTRYLGGLERLEQLTEAWEAIDVPSSRSERRYKAAASAARVALEAVRVLAPIAFTGTIGGHLDTLVTWLKRFDRQPHGDVATVPRWLRVRGAVLGALSSLAAAYRVHDSGATADVTTVSAAIRRWLGTQTFAVSTGDPGLQIVDAQAARFGDFDVVQLVGLIDGEWPERFRRNVLYPTALLSQLEPLPINPDPGSRDRDALKAARASFKDLMHLARVRVRVSTFVLENDAVVEPSMLLDDIDTFALSRQTAAEPKMRVTQSEALALEPRRGDVLAGAPRLWAMTRLGRTPTAVQRFQGEAGSWVLPRVSVSRLERYLDCPFRFFASEVLRLEEQPEDEDTRTPLERGRFLHELFERFFSEWQRRGHRRIDPGSLPEAREVFTEMCEEALARLSPAEAMLERTRLLGSAVSPGIAHRVFALEAERAVDILERFLEYPLQGDFQFRSLDGRERTVTLSAKTDRIDLLADGTLRVIDYKSKQTPDLKVALQLPIYSLCAQRSLDGHRNRKWTLGEALYLSFEGHRTVVPLKAKGRTMDEVIASAEDRLLATLDNIAAGHFPPRPLKKSMCGPCPYATVCRLEYVEEQHEV
jgi:RecB family exonuclease